MCLQSKILTHLRAQPHVWAVGVITADEGGCPHILCCVHGKFLAIEVEEKKAVSSSIRFEQMDRIRWADGWAWKMNNFERFKNALTFLLKKLEAGEW